jgi:DNA-binding NarL/FixJ family response regulator
MQNKSDDDLSSSMRITKGAVRKHISNICLKFNLDSNSSKRVQLTRLVSLHRPELLESKKYYKRL